MYFINKNVMIILNLFVGQFWVLKHFMHFWVHRHKTVWAVIKLFNEDWYILYCRKMYCHASSAFICFSIICISIPLSRRIIL